MNWNQLEQQLKAKEYSSLPQKIMMEKWEASGRDLHTYWNSIEWDSSWLKHDTPEEKLEKRKQQEWESHPFKDFIDKDSILL